MNRRFFLGSFLCVAMTSSFVSAQSDEKSSVSEGAVQVEVQSGRVFVGQIDSRTDAESLWLRYGTSNTTVLRPIQWQYVLQTERGGKPLKKSEAIELARNSKRSERTYLARKDHANGAPSPPPGANHLTDADRAGNAPGLTVRVRSVEMDASLGNWDSDVESDGLVVAVTTLDELGQSLNVDGVLHVTLTASKWANTNSVSNGERIGRIGRWSVALDANHWHGDAYVVRLPFQAVDPELDTTIAAHGLVHVRLVVPGHGTFDRSIDGLRMRTFSPLRDQLERSGQSRWLSHERTAGDN